MADRADELVDLLGCSLAEAQEILEADKKIDKGERMPFDLSPEQEKKAKKYANVTEHRKPTVYQFNQRPRKANPTKAELIEFLKNALDEYADLENLTITNAERQLAFSLNGENFELTLVQKRKKK